MRLRRWMAAVLAAAMVLAMPARAAVNTPAVVKESDGSYTVTYAGEAGKRYTLMVLKEGADPTHLQAGDILYSAVTTAGAEGTVTFANVRLRVNRSADVYVGGPSGRSEKERIVVPGGAVVASVSAEGRGGFVGARAELISETGVIVQVLDPVPPSGICEFDAVPAGRYTLTYTLSGYLKETVQVEMGESGEVRAAAVTLRAGDVNGDGRITPADLALVFQNYQNVGGNIKPAAADLDGDGEVTVKDVALAAGHFMEREG